MSKRAVLLLNLGSPKSYDVEDVRAYLREFLGDRRVLDGNPVARWLLLHGVILRKRPPVSAEAYKKVWMKDGPPLLVFTEQLRAALAAELGLGVFAAMRYGEPSTRDVVAGLVRAGVEDLLVFPQYPHFAMSSYETAVVRVREELRRQAPGMRVHIYEPFYAAPGYIEALVESAQLWLGRPFDRLLFSFHGVPLRHLRREIPDYPDCHEARDCCPGNVALQARDYRHQCFATLEAFAWAAGVPREKCDIAFQSRLGRAVWIRPYTDVVLRNLPAQGVRRLLVLCPAFTADCLETLEEIQMQGRKTFLEAGGESFEQIPCLNAHPAYVRFLAAEARAFWDGRV
ncbi:MAG: ferrochelatase [Puniceicoccales bacterium]|jgi:ferrochelatase|nr:ferrochelatase [Puniceicoccales bacterium]